MRTYWLKIALGAFVIFIVGTLIVNAIRHGHSSVHEMAEGTGPITIPLAFVPFEVEGRKVGTLRQLRIFRDSAQDPTHVEVTISLADTAALDSLAHCILTAQTGTPGDDAPPNDFRCMAAGDTAGLDLIDIGDLRIRNRSETFDLHAPRDRAGDFARESEQKLSAADERAEAARDSQRSAVAERASNERAALDSATRAKHARIDSAMRADMPD